MCTEKYQAIYLLINGVKLGPLANTIPIHEKISQPTDASSLTTVSAPGFALCFPASLVGLQLVLFCFFYAM